MTNKNNFIGYLKKFGVTLIFSSIIAVSSTVTYATDLNGIGFNQTTNTTVENNENNSNSNSNNNSGTNVSKDSADVYDDALTNAESVGLLFENLGPKAEDFAKAKVILEPMAEFCNLITALILGVVSMLLFVITSLDFAYISIAFIRRWLDGGRSAMQPQASGGGFGNSGGFGQGGFGQGGFGNSGGFGQGGFGRGGGMGSPQTNASQPQIMLAQFVSDEAIAAYNEANAQGQNGVPASRKMMILAYAKKRVVFLFAFGLCITLLCTTMFTNLGVNLGIWILGKVSGLI